MLIAVPSEAPGGLDAVVSEHFGHCAVFTLVQVDDGSIGDVNLLANQDHTEGGCMAPVMMLKDEGVEAMVAGGMGMRPLAGFRSVGIKVFFKEDAANVREAVQLIADGRGREFGDDHTCGGGSGGCGGHGHDHHHHHAPVQRDPIEGTPDIRDGRVITFDYDLTDRDGELIETTKSHGPVRYLHGSGNIMPGLEKALAGLEPGAEKKVELPAAEAYGERDDGKILEVPITELPQGVEIGSVLRAHQPDGGVAILTVVGLDDEHGKLDANHPLSGKDLVFQVKIIDVEAATAEEIEHGHVH